MYKDNRHSDLMQHFRGFIGPNRCPGCAGRGTTDRGTTCKACLGDGKLTSAVRGYSVTTLYGAAPQSDKFEESERLKALRELTRLSEEMGGYDPEMTAENPLIRQ